VSAMIMIIIITVNKMGLHLGGGEPEEMWQLSLCDKPAKDFPAYASGFRIDLNSFARLRRFSFGSTFRGR
jgi:hypothetical protein